MADNVLLMNDKSATGALWKAYDISAGWQGQGSSPDAALADVAQKTLNAAAGLGGAAPARIPTVYTQLYAIATAVGTVPLNEYGTGSPSMVVKLLQA